ncbi:MAG: hypothetical protein NVSMB48_18510 [Marmoricola sp.]
MTDASQRAKPITRRTKAITLVPVTVASMVATAFVLTTTGATATLPVKAKPLPGGAEVPVQTIQTQATVTSKNQVAPAVPKNAVDAVVASSTTSGIPTVALNAYQRAAEVINASDPSCGMPWELIGAIGRVESDNGQFGGNHLTTTGAAIPGIYGPVLDGTNGTAVIRDTDGGALDHNTTYDRAVGPMQFLPSTWSVVGVDANGDGKRDPQNINDAALAAAVYLCSGHTNLSNPAQERAAVFRYNHSTPYVDLVLAIAKAYQAGDYSSVPVGSYGANAPASKAALPRANKKPAAKPAKSTPAPSASAAPSPSGSPSPSASPSPTSNPNQPMTPTQAQAYCASHLDGLQMLLWGAGCTKKLTGMTPAQADQGFAQNKNNLGGWFYS